MRFKVIVLTLFTASLVAGCTGVGGSASGGSSAPPLTECQASGTNCAIGDTGPGGGKVFYDAGYAAPWGRYLEVAPDNWYNVEGDPSAIWCCRGALDQSVVPSTGIDIGTGKDNTQRIEATVGNLPVTDEQREGVGLPAWAYATGDHGGKSDWFLPSKEELRWLYLNREAARVSMSGSYWSSSQSADNNIYAWIVDFDSDKVYSSFKDLNNYVRPIRAF